MRQDHLVCIEDADEYICHNCGQLRFNLTGKPVTKCGNCGGTNLEIGEINTLQKGDKQNE